MENISAAELSDLYCAEEQLHTTARFVLIVIASVVAKFGLVTNIMLIWIFIRLTKRERGANPRLYSAALSLFDACICCTFVVIFEFDSFAVYFRSRFFQFLVNHTLLSGFIMGKMVQLGIPYYIIVTSFERWAVMSRFRSSQYVQMMATHVGRSIVIIVILLITISIKAPNLWAFNMYYYENCTDYFRAVTLGATEWYQNNTAAYQLVDFYIGTTLQLFIPFVALIFLNLATISLIKGDQQPDSSSCSITSEATPLNIMRNGPEDRQTKTVVVMLSEAGRTSSALALGSIRSNTDSAQLDHKLPDPSRNRRVREVTTTIVVIVTSYLLCNLPHLLLTVMEQFDADILYETDPETGLKTENSSAFHHVVGDIVSVLFMAQSVLRVAIYYAFNQAVRREITAVFHRKKSRIKRHVYMKS